MKKILVAFIILGLLFAPISAVQAQSEEDEPVYVLLDFDNTVTVDPDDNVILIFGWTACTRGLVQSYLTAVQVELSINDVMVPNAVQYWSPIVSGYGDEWLPYCIAGTPHTLRTVFWLYPLEPIASGDEYEVHFYNWLDHPIIDGADYDGDGRMDFYDGILADRTITIIVN